MNSQGNEKNTKQRDYSSQRPEEPDFDPRKLPILKKIKWLFFSSHNSEKKEDEESKNTADRKEIKKELTEEELKQLETAQRKRKNIIIFICLVAAALISFGSYYCYYISTHVTEKDIQKCKKFYKEENYPKAFKYCYKARDMQIPEISYYLAQMFETGKGLPPKKFDLRQSRSLALKYYDNAASKDFLKAQIKLGNDYMDGSTLTKGDEDMAIKWLRHAARHNHDPSKERLVSLLLKTKKIQEAIEWLKDLSESNNYDASYQLAELYSSGENLKPDYEKAFTYCKAAASGGHADAEHLLALMYESGLGTKPDFEQAYIYETRAALHGSVEASYQSGIMSENGIGTEPDMEKAKEYYESAATLGHDGAAFKLGYFYENGIGTKRDYFQALTWYTTAANNGNTSAMVALGRMYQNGNGTPTNHEEAFFWYQKAAEEPNLEAYFNLGLAYVKGIGTKVDIKKAQEYFTIVAASGYAPAEYELGLIYFQMEKYDLAANWFKKALNQGHSFSAAYLGFMAAKGLGENTSNYMAYFYFLISNELYPNDTTRDNIQLIKSQLSKEQQTAAEIRAKKFINQIKFSQSHPTDHDLK